MADYKDIITGTLNNLVGKAKEFAKSDAVTGLADKVKEVTEGSTVRGVYEQGTSRAKQYGRIAKLSLELNGENEELGRIYAEIGKLYLETHQDQAPEGFFEPLVNQARAVTESIRAKETEIETIKAELEAARAAGIDVEIVEDLDANIADFEQIVDATTEEAPTER